MMRMPTGPGETGKVMEEAEHEAARRDAEERLSHELSEPGAGAETAVAEALPAEPLAYDPMAIRGRRQWPLPKQADPTAPLLAVENLRTHFKLESGWVKAVDGVSFRLDDGEALGLAGESGCGKTTTALSLVQLLPTTPGSARAAPSSCSGSISYPRPRTSCGAIDGGRSRSSSRAP